MHHFLYIPFAPSQGPLKFHTESRALQIALLTKTSGAFVKDSRREYSELDEKTNSSTRVVTAESIQASLGVRIRCMLCLKHEGAQRANIAQ